MLFILNPPSVATRYYFVFCYYTYTCCPDDSLTFRTKSSMIRPIMFRVKPSKVFSDRSFPLVYQRHEARRNVPLHSHDFHELVVILAGRGRHLTDGEEYAIQAGDVFLMHGKMGHGYADIQDMTLANIYFNPRRLRLPLSELRNLPGYQVLFHVEPLLRSREWIRGRLRLQPQDLAKAGVMMAQLQDELSGCLPGYRLMACAHLIGLIRFLSRCYSQAKHPETRSLMHIGEVLSGIERRLAERLTVRQIARMAHMSERSLTRMFRRVTGHSPNDHVIRVRIARASELLLQGDVRVTEAAIQCGFNDSNYFSRQFKKVMGMTPREFRSRGMAAQHSS